ncbi:uncharacterized protein LOC116606690 [Nematostella vectensis]|uniref:uncharacterized protein LOC116606690 n=1 Tax=Nematostella vectensis TaxID=45351 RepID=UPI0020771CBD|nr:uncharacterized protein LOC116606690 [Nematostella vectensis]
MYYLESKYDLKDPSITFKAFQGHISQGGTSVTILTGKPYHKTYQRQKELEKIDDLYRSLEPASDVITVYLTGPPGSGKSQLSRQYGAQYGQRSHHGEGCVVATLHAETPESLLESYKQLVKELGLCISDNTDEATRVKLKTYSQSVKEYLRNTPTPQWLFIVDNVVASEPLTEFWPGRESSWGVGRVIVTTQDAELVPKSSEYARDLSLARGMDEQDAVGLMYLIADLEIDADAIEVARKLDYYPLSLACAAVFIKEMRTDRPVANYRWTNYLSNLNKYFDDLHYPEFQQHNLCYPRSMLPAAVCAAKRMVSNNRFLASAFEFLSHCALQPIPLEVVADHVMRMCDGCQVPDVVKRDIARCSLLICPRSGARGIEVVTMHQVMRTAFTHLRLESRDSDSVGGCGGCEEKDEKCREQRSFLGALDTMNICYQRYKVSLDEYGVSIRILLSPHLQACISTALNRSEYEDTETFVLSSVYFADSLVHVAGATDTQRVQILEHAHDVMRQLGLRSLTACRLLGDLGYTYREAGRLDKVTPVLEEANTIAELHKGSEWMKERSHILNVLGWTYREMFQLDLAQAYMEMSVEVTSEVYGKTHTEVIERLCNLGIILHDAWKNEEALEALCKARDLVEALDSQSRGAIHAQVMNYTAKVYLRWFLSLIHTEGMTSRASEYLENSKAFHEKALEIYERLYSRKHKFYTGTLMTYAIALRHSGDLELARAHCAFALEIYRSSGHCAWPRVATWLADVYLAMKEFQTAKMILHDVIREDERSGTSISPGAYHPRALMAEAMVETGEKVEGERMLKECLAEWQKKGFHPEHYWVTRSHAFLKSRLGKG